MSLYRITCGCRVHKPSPRPGPEGLRDMHRVVRVLNAMFGGNHRIEERRVDAAQSMLDEAVQANAGEAS